MEQGKKVVVIDIQMKFSSMVIFILKFWLASIPATIIIFIVVGLLSVILTFFGISVVSLMNLGR